MNRRRIRLGSVEAAALAAAILLAPTGVSWSADAELRQVGTIQLGSVAGRIDHLAVDIEHRILFVAELGNNTVSAIDLDSGAVRQRIGDLPHPQGLAFVPQTNSLFVATADDSTVRLFDAATLELKATIALGLDPDNVVLDPSGSLVAVGYLNGVAVLDASTGEVLRTTPVAGHVEGLTFDRDGTRILANVPTSRSIAVIDARDGRLIADWPTGEVGLNYRLVIDEGTDHVLAGLRSPDGLAIYGGETGSHLGTLPLCRDVDDLVADPARGLFYAICGDARIMTFARQSNDPGYGMVATSATAPGARTGLFVPEFDRLYIAVPAQPDQAAAIWIFEPA